MSNGIKNWWERTGPFVTYPELRQGNKDHCVYAAIAGAVNHLAQAQIWTPIGLSNQCAKEGLKAPDFGVADVALRPVSAVVTKTHHHLGTGTDRLSPGLIRRWIGEGAIVILSMELEQGVVREEDRKWHMFSLIACDGDRFQVWDTNGFRGYLTDAEITSGFSYRNGEIFKPHDKEDALVVNRTP